MTEIQIIPNHWKLKKLGEICKILPGYGFPKNLQGIKKGEFPFYKVGDISRNVKTGNRILELCDNFIDEKTLHKLKAKPYPKNTIVFAKIGEGLKLNRRAIIGTPGIVDNNAIGVKAIENICEDLFLFYFLNTVKLEDYSKATTVPSVRKSEIEEIQIPVPPLSEQKAIVDKIEELLSDLDNGKQQLLTVHKQLKVYRQSLLKWAFEGKLTNKNVKEDELPNGWKWVNIGSFLADKKKGMATG
ncbi:MAG: restriction endonuclease subunit S [Bacteroidales bacterium]